MPGRPEQIAGRFPRPARPEARVVGRIIEHGIRAAVQRAFDGLARVIER
jgi:hypothetical protein